MVVIFICVAMVTITKSQCLRTHISSSFISCTLAAASHLPMAALHMLSGSWISAQGAAAPLRHAFLVTTGKGQCFLKRLFVVNIMFTRVPLDTVQTRTSPKSADWMGAFCTGRKEGKNCKNNIIYHPCFYVTLACGGGFKSRLLRTKK